MTISRFRARQDMSSEEIAAEHAILTAEQAIANMRALKTGTHANGSRLAQVTTRPPSTPSPAVLQGQTIERANGHSTDRAPATGTLTQQAQPLEPYLPDRYDYMTTGHTFDKPTLTRIGSYEWFSPQHRDIALTALRGALAAAAGQQKNALIFTLTALADIWHKDRATHAAALVRPGLQPVLRDDLPASPPGHASHYSQIHGWQSDYDQVMEPMRNWQSGIPFEILPAVVTLLEQNMPDAMYTLTFRRRQPAPTYGGCGDPYIYAQYGNWYVQVAQWD